MMLEITYEKAKESFKKAFPSRTVHWLTHYSGYWYVLATDDDPIEGDLNPYFKVDDSTGEVGEFYIVQDLPLFTKILEQVKNTQKR